jgi:hypothetical protein
MRYTLHIRFNNSNGVYASIHNTFAEVIAYCQAVCDINCESAISAKIIDRKKRCCTYEGLMNHQILSDLKSRYEKGD